MNLTDNHCVPCDGGTAPLLNGIEDELLKQVAGWEVDRLFEHKIEYLQFQKNGI